MKRHAVPVFFALAFAISWVAWLPALAATLGYLAAPVPVSLIALLGGLRVAVACRPFPIDHRRACRSGRRGYALPRLQRRMRALSASLVLGVVWGFWHLPLFLTVGHPLASVSFGWFLLGIVADSVMFTWLYNNTGGSLLLVLLFHASIAVTGLFLAPASATPLLGVGLKLIAVAAVVAAAGPATLTRVSGRQRAVPGR